MHFGFAHVLNVDSRIRPAECRPIQHYPSQPNEKHGKYFIHLHMVWFPFAAVYSSVSSVPEQYAERQHDWHKRMDKCLCANRKYVSRNQGWWKILVLLHFRFEFACAAGKPIHLRDLLLFACTFSVALINSWISRNNKNNIGQWNEYSMFALSHSIFIPVELRSPNNFQYLYGAHKSVSGILRINLFTMQTRRPKHLERPKIDIHANRMLNDAAASKTVPTFDMKILCDRAERQRERTEKREKGEGAAGRVQAAVYWYLLKWAMQ